MDEDDFICFQRSLKKIGFKGKTEQSTFQPATTLEGIISKLGSEQADMQQQGHGRGGNRPEQVGRDMRMGMGMGMSMGMPYGPMAEPEFAWGYGYPLPIPTQSVFKPPTFVQGMQRPNFPLGMQRVLVI
eukprot:Gb_12168 [translate_table: standard]